MCFCDDDNESLIDIMFLSLLIQVFNLDALRLEQHSHSRLRLLSPSLTLPTAAPLLLPLAVVLSERR